MMKSFKLTDLEKRSLIQQNEIKNIVEYDWKNLNVIRLNPTKPISAGDTNIEFQLDTSRLANNFPLNRIRMNAKIKVTATAAASKYYQKVQYAPDTNGYLLIKGTDNNAFYQPYLMSPSNGGLDAFVLNKAFSNIKIKNGANDLRDDKRSFSKIDLLGRFMSPEKCEKWGIYPDYEKGSYNDKISSSLEILPIKNVDAIATTLDPLFVNKTAPRYLEENIFWKRNTNGQYINTVSNKFTRPGQPQLDAVTPVVAVTGSYLRSGNALEHIYKINPQSGEKEYYYMCFPNGTYEGPTGISQEIVYDVDEDLISDITITRYSRDELFRGLPSSLLSFSFNVSPLINQLYKTSNQNIGNISVSIESMSLDFFTYNYGLLGIQPTTYYVPFYQEQDVSQKIQVSTTGSVSNIVPQTIKFNKMPTYVMVYVEENLASNQNNSMNLNTIPIEEMRLTIDNDQGAALYGLNQVELEEMSVNNFGNYFANFEAMYRTKSWFTPIESTYQSIIAGSTASSPINLTPAEMMKLTNAFIEPSKPFISGVYLLKIGHDIRIDPMMMPSLNRPTSFTFTLKVGQQWAKYATANSATFHCVAFNPSYYIMNPQTGLLATKDISYTEDEMLGFVTSTNSQLTEVQKQPNNQVYDTKHPQMMLGSGWYAGLSQSMRNGRI